MKKFIADKAFYKTVFSVFIPIMIQMTVTNFVSLLDNVMVGTLGTESMSGVSIINQFIFIFNLLVFGALSAAGIFTSQYYGNGDVEGVRSTFRFKLIINTAVALLCIGVFLAFYEPLINMFLHESADGGNLDIAFSEAKSYLFIIVIGLLPYAISQVYASTLKETGDAVIPMISSIVAVATNCILNALLIFGLCGFPALGVRGAAIATVISRFAELAVVAIRTHVKSNKYPFIKHAYRSMYIPAQLVKAICIKGMPLILNEFLWACAMTFRNQCYSTRGLEVLAANSIATTLSNMFSVVYLAMGSSVAIIIGARLGAGEIPRAKDESRKLIAFSVFLSVIFGALLGAVSGIFPKLYDVEDTVRTISTFMLVITAILMPVYAYSNAAYYTIRSGGRVFMTLMLDSGFMWGVVVPITSMLCYFTDIGIFLLYPICQSLEIIKIIIATIMLKKSDWANRLISDATI